MLTREQRIRHFWYGVIIVSLAVVIACIGVCMRYALVIEVEADKPAAATKRVRIVYTQEAEPETETTRAPFYPLTTDEREYFASLVAGKAVGEPAGCQQAAATVLYNDLTASGGEINKAVRDYTWGDIRTPTDDTYEAVDAVFLHGQMLLDSDVLWMGKAGEPDAFHAGLEEVCTIGGITFYRAYKQAIVPGGAAQ